MAHPRGFEPLTSAFGGLCGTLKFQRFISDFNKLASLDVAVNRYLSLPSVPKLCPERSSAKYYFGDAPNSPLVQ